MPTAHEARVVNLALDVEAQAVYAYARQMRNLPAWASGLAGGIEEVNGAWFTDSPMGRVQVEMAPPNDFGVLDHEVTLPDGTRVHNALRVTPCGPGSLLSFVVLRLPGVAQETFDADVDHVRRDLGALKKLLEGVKPALAS
ncbi:MAG: polyketide cyclase [Rhodoferax sp.]|nr:polyketide cyclase [Rhodoferax sp.]